MKKSFAVYKRIVGEGTERVVDSVEADNFLEAIQATVGAAVGLHVVGAVRYMHDFFTGYSPVGEKKEIYFAGEVI